MEKKEEKYTIRWLTQRTVTPVKINNCDKKEKDRIVRSIKKDGCILLGVEKNND